MVSTPELRELIPRYEVIPEANAHYNSTRRHMIRSKNPQKAAVTIEIKGALMSSQMPLHRGWWNDILRWISILVTQACAIKTPLGHKFLTLGRDTLTGDRYVVLADLLTSLQQVQSSSRLPCDVDPSCEDQWLIPSLPKSLLTIPPPLSGASRLQLTNDDCRSSISLRLRPRSGYHLHGRFDRLFFAWILKITSLSIWSDFRRSSAEVSVMLPISGLSLRQVVAASGRDYVLYWLHRISRLPCRQWLRNKSCCQTEEERLCC